MASLAHTGYFTTLVDPNSTVFAFALHIVKTSYEHSKCTRPALPPTLQGVRAETITFKLAQPLPLSIAGMYRLRS